MERILVFAMGLLLAAFVAVSVGQAVCDSIGQATAVFTKGVKR